MINILEGTSIKHFVYLGIWFQQRNFSFKGTLLGYLVFLYYHLKIKAEKENRKFRDINYRSSRDSKSDNCFLTFNAILEERAKNTLTLAFHPKWIALTYDLHCIFITVLYLLICFPSTFFKISPQFGDILFVI